VIVNPDGTFTVDFSDSPAGTTPFDRVELDITVPAGGVTVSDLILKSCVKPGKNSYPHMHNYLGLT